MDSQTLSEIQSILGNNSKSNGSGLIDLSALIAPLMPFIIVATIVSVIITITYILSTIDKWRANRATIEMRNILREMNERDKSSREQPSRQDALDAD